MGSTRPSVSISPGSDMGQITLDYDDAMAILRNPKARGEVRCIAALTVAVFETYQHADQLDAETRSVTLKLAHMAAAAIYNGDH